MAAKVSLQLKDLKSCRPSSKELIIFLQRNDSSFDKSNEGLPSRMVKPSCSGHTPQKLHFGLGLFFGDEGTQPMVTGSVQNTIAEAGRIV